MIEKTFKCSEIYIFVIEYVKDIYIYCLNTYKDLIVYISYIVASLVIS
jgi:hypothetical protein